MPYVDRNGKPISDEEYRTMDAAQKIGYSQAGPDVQSGAPGGGTGGNLDPKMPERPQITSLLNPDTGMLKQQYLLNAQPDVNVGKLDVNTTALNELQNRGLSQGPSTYANILGQQQALGEQNALSDVARSNAGASSSAYSQAASHGGLSTGGRERLATLGQNNLAAGQQGVLRAGMGQRLDIGAQDEAQKLGILQSLPGMQAQLGGLQESDLSRLGNLGLANRDYSTGLQKLNIAGSLGEVGRQDDANLQSYLEKMRGYAAGQTANAQAHAGKKG